MRRKLEGISNTVMVIFMIVFMVFCVFYVNMETNKEEPETVMTEEEQLQTEETEISPSITVKIHNKVDYDYNKYWELVQDSVGVDLGEYYAASSKTYEEDNYYALISYTSSTETHKYWVSVFVKEDGTVYDIDVEGWEL